MLGKAAGTTTFAAMFQMQQLEGLQAHLAPGKIRCGCPTLHLSAPPCHMRIAYQSLPKPTKT